SLIVTLNTVSVLVWNCLRLEPGAEHLKRHPIFGFKEIALLCSFFQPQPDQLFDRDRQRNVNTRLMRHLLQDTVDRTRDDLFGNCHSVNISCAWCSASTSTSTSSGMW